MCTWTGAVGCCTWPASEPSPSSPSPRHQLSSPLLTTCNWFTSANIFSQLRSTGVYWTHFGQHLWLTSGQPACVESTSANFSGQLPITRPERLTKYLPTNYCTVLLLHFFAHSATWITLVKASAQTTFEQFLPQSTELYISAKWQTNENYSHHFPVDFHM